MLSRLLVGVLIGATAIPGPAAAAGAAPAPPPPPVPGAVRITLITGDTVELTKIDSRYAATVRPAPGRERITFHTIEADGGLRILPSDAIPLVGSGRVDAELFDVERLVAQGYGDAASPTLPLIVQGGGAALRTADAHPLTSINATAIRPAKSTLAGFWQTQSAAARTAGVTRIWLDGKVKPVLDRSTAQIGAPAAWQAGFDGRGVKVAVLDTGVDATHPDLAGKITEARNFSSSPDTVDRFGHGTHVAATVAGTGAGSDGKRKGVAYGADLLIGKVLGDDGYGYDSEIIAGMQWAVDAGAKVVNMSLGGEATDGTDPMSVAVDEISAATGALFVVAAGNEGADSTVGTPGAAPNALTVGAVDRSDQLADFSSRGPRLGDLGLKPEITAPGVEIVAARAAGTTMGNPVDELYTGASGTSMATPHIAGAAALLAQQHPDWTGPKIKEALVSTAKTTPDLSVYAQGAGRVDLTRATTQTVTGTGVADFGLHTVGETPAVATRTVTYSNASTAPVTLTLKAPAGVTTDTTTVTVPARGSATTVVSIDFGKRDPGRLSGWLTATAPGGVLVTTAIGATLDGPTHRITVKAVDRSGKPAAVPALTIHGDDSRSDVLGWFDPGGATYEVQAGTYLLDALLEDGGPLDEQANLTTIPELKVDKDITVLVDARKGTPIRIETPKPSEQQTVLSYYVHRVTGTGRSISHGVMHFSTIEQVNVVPTKKVTKGSFEFSSRWQLVAPMVQAKVPGVSGPLDINLFGTSPAYAGTKKFPLVRWGAAAVRGKAVLIPATDEDEMAQIDAAAKAGAAVALLVRPADQSAWTVYVPDAEERLPVVSLAVANDAGAQLLARAARPGATIDLTLTTSSPYLYDVLQVSKDRVPDRIVHRVTAANSMRIRSEYAHNGGLNWVREQRFGWRPWQTFAWNDTSRSVQTPSVREEWVSAGDSVWQHRVHSAYPWGGGVLRTGFTDRARSFAPGRTRETWSGPVVRPAAPAGISSTRTGDVLHLRVAEFVDSDGHYEEAGADEATATLWRDGKKLADLPDAWQDVTTTPGTAAYKLRLTTARGGDDWQFGTRTETEWTFRSGADGTLPLLHVGYDGRKTMLPHLLKLKFPAKLTSLKVDVSADDGASWKKAVTVGESALIPGGRKPVSLRVTATDRAGNTVTQTVIRAYGRG
ncbi:S8 family serine peptidase [Actinoplanes friuliensis]|uniref:Peptidase S8/S53 subtilisin kexin sedolisin n=1 Tax=Actinoplanes friuliensis DSM 7358 TaxID=1246995 RepID=U5WB54_9ACTN|nr:S8 family serine peptidase [Actinoplanes friuliensis]AGZ45166.1 peptidase S8/S53 subtilisin kexin sedolisin [Actinoplanes friuliensis DSM 7358]